MMINLPTVTMRAVAGVVLRRPLPLDAYPGHANAVTAFVHGWLRFRAWSYSSASPIGWVSS
jgi:hypothetical protein